MRRRYCPNGDRMLLIELSEEISVAIHNQVLALARELEKFPTIGVVEWIPSYRSLGVIYDPDQISYRDLVARFEALESSSNPEMKSASSTVEILVCYGGEMGPDLNFVARHNQMSAEEVIQIHTSVDYRVFLLGFSPGFPYLGGMSPRIATPRLEEPRLRVPAGSVAIGGNQTGIYPTESPGGWRLIGRTPLQIFDLDREKPFLLNPGDGVRFRSVTAHEFQGLQTSRE
jgi:inhibitor of KinA